MREPADGTPSEPTAVISLLIFDEIVHAIVGAVAAVAADPSAGPSASPSADPRRVLPGSRSQQQRAMHQLVDAAMLQAYRQRDACLVWLIGLAVWNSEMLFKEQALAISHGSLLLQIGDRLKPRLSYPAVSKLFTRFGELQESTGDFSGAALSYKRVVSACLRGIGYWTDDTTQQRELVVVWCNYGLARKRNFNFAQAFAAYKQALKAASCQ